MPVKHSNTPRHSVTSFKYGLVALVLASFVSCATVTTITVDDPMMSVPGTSAEGERADSRYLVFVGANPYRFVEGSPGMAQQEPVGLVMRRGNVIVQPEPPYWAIGGSDDRDLQIFPQAQIPPELRWGVGGFYPLLLDGHNVAEQFPGRYIRAARVAVAWQTTKAPYPEDVTIVVSTGSMPWYRGLTTGELAAFLQEMGMTHALNMDGGRASAVYVGSPNEADRIPRNIFATPPGPVFLKLSGFDGGSLRVPARVIHR